MRIGLAQINTTVGDLEGNRQKILTAYRQLCAEGAQLVVFPELAVCGYPPRDLLFRQRFIADVEASLEELASAIGPVPALIGTVTRNTSTRGRPAWNAAALCQDGRVTELARKCRLPSYDVFDEDRYFEPADEPLVVELLGQKVAVTICEDIWSSPKISTSRNYRGVDPIELLAARHCDLMINLSASPWSNGKRRTRHELLREAVEKLGCPIVYVNAVGGNDELIFDGHSLVADHTGELLATLAPFEEEIRLVDTDAPPSQALATNRDERQDIYDALVLGLRDYAHKSGFRDALVALSGGIDSAVVAVLAKAALGAEHITGVSLPSEISSQHSRDDARQIAVNLGIRFESVGIADTVAACEYALDPLFAGRDPDVTEENIQARVRGVLMMALSNKLNALLLSTGNKSEMAIGYCTLYGDMCGGLSVISDVLKTQVYALARWINKDREIIPSNTINKPPSAELRPGQTDQDSLPEYETLDGILRGYVEQGLSRHDLVASGFEPRLVDEITGKVDRNEYKRKQAAPGLKVSPLAFGVGRRIPIVQKYVS